MVSDDWFSEGETTAVRIPATVNAPREQRVSQVWQWVRTLTACCVPSRFGRLVIALTSLNIAAAFCLLMEPTPIRGPFFLIRFYVLCIFISFFFTIAGGRLRVRERLFLICCGVIALAAMVHSWTRAQYIDDRSELFARSNTVVIGSAVLTLASILLCCFVVLKLKKFCLIQQAWASLFASNRLFFGCLAFILVGALILNADRQGMLPNLNPENDTLAGVLAASAFFSFLILPSMIGGAVRSWVQLLAVWIFAMVGMVLSGNVLGNRVIPLSQDEIMSLYGLLFLFIIWPLFQSPTAFEMNVNAWNGKWARRLSRGAWGTLLFSGLFLIGFLFTFDLLTLMVNSNSVSPIGWRPVDFRAAYTAQRLKRNIVVEGHQGGVYIVVPDDADHDFLSRLTWEGFNFNFCRLQNVNSEVDLSCLEGDSRFFYISDSQLSTSQLKSIVNGSNRLILVDVDIHDDGSPPLERIAVNDVLLMSLGPGGLARFFSISHEWDVTNPQFNLGSVTISGDELTRPDWEGMLQASRKLKSSVTFSSLVGMHGQIHLPDGLQTQIDDRLILQVAADADFDSLRSLILFINSTHIRVVLASSTQFTGTNPARFELERLRASATYDAVWSTWGGYDSMVYDDHPMEYRESTMITPEKMLELFLAFGPSDSPFRDLYLPEKGYLEFIRPEDMSVVKSLIVDPAWLKNSGLMSPNRMNMVKQFPKDRQFLWPANWKGISFPALEVLHLDSEFLIGNFAFLSATPNLREMKINCSKLTPGEFAIWAKELRGLKQLETLYCDGKLDGNQILVIKGLPSLRRLVLDEDFCVDINEFRKREKIPARIELTTRAKEDYRGLIPDSFLTHRRRVMEKIRDKYQLPAKAKLIE